MFLKLQTGIYQFCLYKNYSEVYTLLYKSNLSHLVLDNIKAVCGPKTEQDNLQAYFNSWLAYGLFGWINEWIARGMKESPESMAKLRTSKIILMSLHYS